MKIKSVKQESLLKQFYLYFAVATVIPLSIFIYLIKTTQLNSIFLIFIAFIFSILGFWGTRSFLARIVVLSKQLKADSWEKLDTKAILDLAEENEGEVANLAKVFGGIANKLEENVRQLEDTKKTLYRVLSKIGKAISSTENFDSLLQFTLETIIEALRAKKGEIYFLEEELGILKPRVVFGVDKKDVPEEIKFGEDTVGWVAKERKPLIVPLLEEKQAESLFSPPLISAPLVVHDKLWGVICLSGKDENNNFSDDELKILSNLAYQIAISFENAKLNEEAERTYFETISALALAVEAKDPYSRGHSDRVATYAIKIAEGLGVSEEDLNTIRDASKLHDIGKIGIIDEILKKPSQLNPEEEIIMHKHPVIGEGIVKPLRSFDHILHTIRHHHELLDGSGYPDGLKGDEISLVTRILTVADIFDALTTDRPYRRAFNSEDTKRELRLMADNSKIDKKIVDVTLNLIDTKKI